MYPYHNKIIQRIKNGELVSAEKHNHAKIGECVLLRFNTEPFTRPVRLHALWRYEGLINIEEWFDGILQF